MRKNRSKKIMVIIGSLMMAGVMAACGSASSSGNGAETTKVSELRAELEQIKEKNGTGSEAIAEKAAEISEKAAENAGGTSFGETAEEGEMAEKESAEKIAETEVNEEVGENTADNSSEDGVSSAENSEENAAGADAVADDVIRPEFKEAMDSYEAFYEQYCEVLKKYSANPADLTILTEYMELVGKLEEMDKKFEQWNSGDLSKAELSYYLDVNNRIQKMLLDCTS